MFMSEPASSVARESSLTRFITPCSLSVQSAAGSSRLTVSTPVPTLWFTTIVSDPSTLGLPKSDSVVALIVSGATTLIVFPLKSVPSRIMVPPTK